MTRELNSILSDNAKGMKRSAIRELLKLTSNPEIISFAGGLPSPLSFPVDDLKSIVNEMMETEATTALQYGSTEGDTLLREELVKLHQKQGMNITIDNLIITTASQQGLDLIAKLFINRGDKIIVGLPSYLGGLSAFNSYGADMVGVSLDDKGMSSVELEKVLEDLKTKNDLPKFIYIIPDFQNPAGITMTEKRRIEILKIANKYNILVIEDSPYRELRYEGKPQKTLYELDNSGNVITLGTFSKIFAPGLRIGWVIADNSIVDKIVVAKQAADLCTSPYTQRIAARYLQKGLLEKAIKNIIKMYKEKKNLMMDSLEKYMPAGVKWTNPEGGLFLLLTFPNDMDSEKLFKVAIDKKVAFVIGNAFRCDDGGKSTARLNFSYASEEQIVEGIKRLAESIKEYK